MSSGRLLRGLAALAMSLTLYGCSGSDGNPGASGQNGTNGTNGTDGTNGTNGKDLTAAAKPESCSVCHSGAGASHESIYKQYTNATTLNAVVNDVTSTLNADNTTFTSVLTVTVTQNGQPITDPTLLKQKTFYAVQYDPAAGKFPTAKDFSFPASGSSSTLAAVDGSPGRYTVTQVKAPFAPEVSANSFIYGYVATGAPIVAPKGHYNLYPDVYNFGVVLNGSTVDYTSAANVSGCEKCHGAPYRKHGYRMAVVSGLNDFVACKACHTDQRVGSDHDWQVLADNPLAYATAGVTDADKIKYAYTATVMNDTHMSHAMEFAYPQSMANCVTCHDGKLDRVLDNKFFTLKTCKSCHPMTGPEEKYLDGKRAPPLKTLLVKANVASFHPADLYAAGADAVNCTLCHTGLPGARKFSEMHAGYDKQVSDGTSPYASTITSQVDSASFDSATNKLTVKFSVAGASATALVKPTLVVGLYGYDTKDFIVSGHGGQADGTRNLEWTEGAKQRSDPTKSANSDRLTVSPGTAAAGVKEWTVTADLSLWAGMITDGSVKKVEVAFLPSLGLNQAAAVSATNPAIAIAGATTTFDLVGKAIVANVFGKGTQAIVAASKCNDCHAALGTTFHSPSYGSAGVVGCRICHTVRDGGGHLEMQSRSIDSYVHAIHSFQAFDAGSVDFSDPVEAMRYKHHTESTYPNFTTLNCESCHTGTYEVPDQAKSLPGVLSKAATLTQDRAIGAVPSYVTGAASRACGSCHRAEMINEDQAGELASFNEHTGSFGTLIEATTGAFDAAVAKVMGLFK